MGFDRPDKERQDFLWSLGHSAQGSPGFSAVGGSAYGGNQGAPFLKHYFK